MLHGRKFVDKSRDTRVQVPITARGTRVQVSDTHIKGYTCTRTRCTPSRATSVQAPYTGRPRSTRLQVSETHWQAVVHASVYVQDTRAGKRTCTQVPAIYIYRYTYRCQGYLCVQVPDTHTEVPDI